MFRFFINPHEINWQEKHASITDTGHTYKISKVLRLRENDQITLLDGKGLVYNAQIVSINPKVVKCRLLSRRAVNTEPEIKITLAQAILKGQKFDFVLQKNTEIGICEFVPILTERTVVRFEEDGELRKEEKRLGRYQKIVQEAAEQSERGVMPVVYDIISLDELCKSNLTDYDLKIICQERTQTNFVKDVLNSIQTKVQKILILIGPEGGFTENELKLTTSSGFVSVSLGRRIYRAETVGIVLSSILFFYFNDLK